MPEASPGPTDPIGIDQIDLDAYDLEGFRADIAEIVDLQQAAISIAKWAIGIPIAVTVLIWLVFSERMNTWALVPYAALVFVFSAVGAAMLGVFFVAKHRVARTTEASGRVVELIGRLHGDYERVQHLGGSVSIRDVGASLAKELVFPAVFGFAGQSATLAGPAGFLLRPALKWPMKMVERKVVAALEQLPDEPPVGQDSLSPEERSAQAVDRLATGAADATSAISDRYQEIQSRLEEIVGKVGVIALGPLAALLFLSIIPLAVLLVLGWSAT